MMTLRQGIEMMQLPSGTIPETPNGQPIIQPRQAQSDPRGGFGSSPGRNPLIRRPSPIYVDADSD